MKDDRTTGFDPAILLNEYIDYLSKPNADHTIIVNESKNLSYQSRKDTIRFMEKIMLNRQTNPKRKTRNYLVNSCPSHSPYQSPFQSQRKYLSIDINSSNRRRNQNPKKLLFPPIMIKKAQMLPQHKPTQSLPREHFNMNKHSKDKRNEENSNQKSAFKKIQSRHILGDRPTVKFGGITKEKSVLIFDKQQVHKEEEANEDNEEKIIFTRKNTKEISTGRLINVEELHNAKIVRNKFKRMNTISFNPYLKQLHETIKEDKEETIIINYTVTSASYLDKSIKETNFIFNMNRILNVKSYSIYAIFEGQGKEAAYLASYAKNMFASIMTQALTYEFKSPYINSMTVYASLMNNDFAILKGVMEKINEFVSTSTMIDLTQTSYSFAAVLIIGSKVITVSQGETRAILIKKTIERDVERFMPIALSSNSEDRRELSITHQYITNDVINMVIGSRMIWDDNNRPYANILKVLSSAKMDTKEKCDLIMKFKKKQSMTWPEKYDFSFLIIDFERRKSEEK